MQWLKEAAEKYPSKIAIECNDQSLTYHALYEKALQVALKLKTLQQKRVALQAENTLNDCLIIHGAILAGIELVMINKHLTEKEITRQMNSVNTELLISNDKFDNLKPISKTLIMTDLSEQINSPIINQPDDILSIMFTSGTTGVQKAVPQRYINHFTSAENCKETLTYHHDSVWLDVLPLFHISGLSILLRAVMDGCTVVLHEKFDAQQIIQDIQEKNITHISLVPQTLERLLSQGLNAQYALEGILIGGAKLDERLLNEARTVGLPIYTSFGMTETCSQMITATPDDIKQYPKSVGRINNAIQIFHAQNGIGEIGVKGENVMTGYIFPDNANDEAFKDGFFLTGDIGYIDNGYLYILDRRKDLIISGGENIYPSEIEQVLLSHTDVSAVAIIGIEDVRWGSIPICLYEAEDDMTLEMKSLLNDMLAKYKHPKAYYQVDKLIRTSNGKISRHLCKEWFIHEYQPTESLSF
ncbi:o-succinylbenzoate--CoA ligase [Macrococcoides caseolyticum]|uniref:o-succinylbenzoate--CoA ligase n=1 Tax=Macrococcoides caseolyticum TaxID=69966 RepID=UPI001F191D01|nr:o-succinylbenzoate--CoA ligase [Macrococcus caseolyticus]MCE4957969.1 o-succinylbenzoate--CoA ligase [Macrococcus caseolyticus]